MTGPMVHPLAAALYLKHAIVPSQARFHSMNLQCRILKSSLAEIAEGDMIMKCEGGKNFENVTYKKINSFLYSFHLFLTGKSIPIDNSSPFKTVLYRQ